MLITKLILAILLFAVGFYYIFTFTHKLYKSYLAGSNGSECPYPNNKICNMIYLKQLFKFVNNQKE